MKYENQQKGGLFVCVKMTLLPLGLMLIFFSYMFSILCIEIYKIWLLLVGNMIVKQELNDK